MILLRNIRRTYTSDEIETAALADINLQVAQGEFVAIMGPSGCGKSTLLNILGTIDRPTAGSYMFDDRELAIEPEAVLAQHRAEKLGFVFQSFNLIDELTIAENVELGLNYRKHGIGSRSSRINTAMDRVGIAHRARHYPHQLSGGQQQRAAIARAIVGDPSLILADEPTGNLDTDNSAQIMGILQTLHAEGATIIMVTHSPAQAGLAQRRVDMLDGRIVPSPTPAS
jgi:putative ABC transport system ATP-binding protein